MTHHPLPQHVAAWRRPRQLVALPLTAALLVGGLGACGKAASSLPGFSNGCGAADATPPAGTDALTAAATAMTSITSVHLELALDPPLGTFPALKHADLDLESSGNSKGTIVLNPTGTNEEGFVSLNFIALGPTAERPSGASYVYLDGAGWQAYDQLIQAYDPEIILDPQRGIPKMLSTTTDASTVGSEKVDGVCAWKTTVTFDSATISDLVHTELGDGALTGSVWTAQDTNDLVKAQVHVPESEHNPDDNVTFTLSQFNETFDISQPTTAS